MNPRIHTRSSGLYCLLLCVIVALACLLTAPLQAQNSQGTILGHVVDPSGAVLAKATVTITNVAPSVATTTTTSSVGDFVFVNVIPGNYDIVVEASGFKKAHAVAVRLDVDAPLRQAFKLG